MTIAIGMVCQGCVLVASDTRISYDGGKVSDAKKITDLKAKGGVFAFAHSSNDANAATALIGEIRQEIENWRFEITSSTVGTPIKMGMQRWWLPHGDNHPVVYLLLGACFGGESEPSLFFCEPPNVVIPVQDNYKCIGDGWEIADPIYEWFRPNAPSPLHASLCQISYMLYKAKTLMPATIGGDTDVDVLTDCISDPLRIDRISMRAVEWYGIAFERHLSKLASLAMEGSLEGQKDVLRAAEGIYSSSMMYASAEFRCQFPDKPIRRQFYT
ncbi:MAG: hypothetical protein WCF26_01630 [Candidatus Sulfotelmatobacter sp.]